ncbi:class I SAM-dependent methyltransferase [Geoglobus acetivorans]|uniref:SAM-dependent methyltransferase n=1 Tax=Geoglobus acetivorans TaxID=565033 RepID=A0A0A7GCS3_GEOAI|nr:SAM-dependent methyltransferase [Geoglobus acetivorans]
MPHRYSGKPEALKSEKRRRILPVDVFEKEVIGKVRCRENAVDYGAGPGYFTIPLAKHFKRVYAIDANIEMVEALRSELERLKIKNVGIVLSERLPEFDFPVDFVLFSNVLHEVDDWRGFLEWASKAKVVCVIEWKKIEMDYGPPVEERIDENEMEKALRENFRFVEKLPIYAHHYTLMGYNEKDALNEPD